MGTEAKKQACAKAQGPGGCGLLETDSPENTFSRPDAANSSDVKTELYRRLSVEHTPNYETMGSKSTAGL